MKKLYVLFLMPFICQSQVINIPDPNFKNALLIQTSDTYGANQSGAVIPIDANADGEISVEEAQAIYSLHIANIPIADLTGFEFFSNLEHIHFQSTSLTQLNLSSFPDLRTLYCSGNNISSLDVSVVPELESLKCSGNPINTLDITGLQLTMLQCANNNLSVWTCRDSQG